MRLSARKTFVFILICSISLYYWATLGALHCSGNRTSVTLNNEAFKTLPLTNTLANRPTIYSETLPVTPKPLTKKFYDFQSGF